MRGKSGAHLLPCNLLHVVQQAVTSARASVGGVHAEGCHLPTVHTILRRAQVMQQAARQYLPPHKLSAPLM